MARRDLITQSKEKILTSINMNNGNLSLVAKDLGTSRPSLYSWMKADGIDIDNVIVKKSKSKDVTTYNPNAQIGNRFTDNKLSAKKPSAKKKVVSRPKRKIRSANQFFEYLEKHPEHLHAKFFLDRKNNPRRPDVATIEKVFSILNEAEI